MSNKQRPLPLDVRNDGSLDVHSIWRTIQGEGPFAGRSAVFVRLFGCVIQCPLCDTDYTSRRIRWSVSSLVNAVNMQRHERLPVDLVVLTGGEPLRQNVLPLCDSLAAHNYTVQIETNGTCWLQAWDYTANLATIVCSPKTSRVHPAMHRSEIVWKFVLSHDAVCPYDGLPLNSLGMSQKPARPNWLGKEDVLWASPANIYVQPLDTGDSEENQRNLEAAARSCMEFGYRLGVQMHKLAGLS